MYWIHCYNNYYFILLHILVSTTHYIYIYIICIRLHILHMYIFYLILQILTCLSDNQQHVTIVVIDNNTCNLVSI